MAFSNIDRTEEIEARNVEMSVKSSDHCHYYKKHPYTVLWRKECWTCKYSDFGIDTGRITENGICKYPLLHSLGGEK